jgi:antitoxin YefM
LRVTWASCSVTPHPTNKAHKAETIPITEAKARIAELADRVAREHDHFTITRNGRADVMLISVAEYESMQETLDILSDDEALADLRQSREDFACGDTFDAAQVRAELEQRRGTS